MKNKMPKRKLTAITAAQFDAKFSRREDISPFLDFKKAALVRPTTQKAKKPK